MPWTEEQDAAEHFLSQDGVHVYHTYRDDDMTHNPPYENYFVTNAWHGWGESFDVRELSTWVEPPHPPYLTGENNTPENKKLWEEYHENKVYENAVRAAIIAAIDKGEIVADPDDDGPGPEISASSIQERKPRVVIIVRGGCVECVYVTPENESQIEVVDFDGHPPGYWGESPKVMAHDELQGWLEKYVIGKDEENQE